MRIIGRAWEAFVDFIFPKSQKIINLESLSAGELLRILPPADCSDLDGNNIALFDYNNTLVRDLIWELKYTGNKIIAQKLGAILYDVLRTELAERMLTEKFTAPLLVPMPISDKRRNERGWNQSELLCQEVKKLDTEGLFKYLPRQLVKHRHTESQTKTTSKSERLANLKDSLRVLNVASVEGKCIMLIDDVTTSGATFAEAKRALKAADAKKIICFAIAHS